MSRTRNEKQLDPHRIQDTSASQPRALLRGLLDYLLEQARQIDPRGFRLAAHQDFMRRRDQVCGLPGVATGSAGADSDTPWLKIERLLAQPARPFPRRTRRRCSPCTAIRSAPARRSTRLRWRSRWRLPSRPGRRSSRPGSAAQASRRRPSRRRSRRSGRRPSRARSREAAEAALARYRPLWTAWAEAERPRRRSIEFYGELFALHQRLRDDTANPCELAWGIGIASWRLAHDGMPLDFEYRLITQELEIDVNDLTLAIEVRPRAVAPRLEMDAFVACGVPAAIDTERSIREQLKADGAVLVTPFDAGPMRRCCAASRATSTASAAISK